MSNKENTHTLYGFSYGDRQELLPELKVAVTEAGGWLLEHHSLSATTMQFRVEIQVSAVEELYGALMGTGLELTRPTHATLTELCLCRRYAAEVARTSQVVTISLELSFLEDVTLHSLLSTGAAVA